MLLKLDIPGRSKRFSPWLGPGFGGTLETTMVCLTSRLLPVAAHPCGHSSFRSICNFLSLLERDNFSLLIYQVNCNSVFNSVVSPFHFSYGVLDSSKVLTGLRDS